MPSLRILCPALLSLMLLSGCGQRYKLHREELGSSVCYGPGQGLSQPEAVGFSGKLDIVWERGTAGKPAGPLSLCHNMLVLPETKKRLKFFDIATGRYRGKINAKGVPQSGVVIVDSLGMYGISPRKGKIYGVDLLRRKRVWEQQVKDALAGPILENNRLYMSSGNGVLQALDPIDGTVYWQYRSDTRFAASARPGFGRLYQPADRGVLIAVSADDGREEFRVTLNGPLTGPVVVAGERVYSGDVYGNVYALAPEDGRIIWRTSIDGPIWSSPTVSGSLVLVGQTAGYLVALDAASGEIIWRYDAGEVIRVSPLVIGDIVVVGTMAGRVITLDVNTGAQIAVRELKGGIMYPPISDGQYVMVATQAGKIVCFGEPYEQRSHADQGIVSQHQSE
ncbi:MAG: PQQ-binding-like beta-propeller repeat protein [candidate division Zixibacteria bacterium]|nr:PQQ-binding-like beta-propeller repeat protein [candidate division Zixibacteria bacterium]